MCMLNHYLAWDKWVLTNFDHDRQWFNTGVTKNCFSLSGRGTKPKTNPKTYTNPNPNTNSIQLFYASFEHRLMIFKLAHEYHHRTIDCWQYFTFESICEVITTLYNAR